MKWVVDELLDHPDPYHLDLTEAKEVRFKTLKQAFDHHYNNCGDYGRYCDSLNVKPDDLKTPDDIKKIPLLPIQVFKERKILSVPEDGIELICKSSGTGGMPSHVYKDSITLSRARKHLALTARKFLPLIHGFMAVLSPTFEEMDAWVVWVMSYVSTLFDESEFFVKQGNFIASNVVKKLIETNIKPRHLMGPPFLVMAVVKYCQKNGISVPLDAESTINTGGGWKNFEGKKISQQMFRELVSKTLSINQANIIDSLGLVEINSLMVDCEYHHKHIPPWAYVSIRDPQDSEKEVEMGEEGLIGYLDSISPSYPAFILSDDIGRLIVPDGEKCECGRIGPCLQEEIRRAKGAEARGCSLKIEQFTKIVF